MTSSLTKSWGKVSIGPLDLRKVPEFIGVGKLPGAQGPMKSSEKTERTMGAAPKPLVAFLGRLPGLSRCDPLIAATHAFNIAQAIDLDHEGSPLRRCNPSPRLVLLCRGLYVHLRCLLVLPIHLREDPRDWSILERYCLRRGPLGRCLLGT